jgi:hypothetical protein
MVVLFVGAESAFAYFEATHKYLERYGKPQALAAKGRVERAHQNRRFGKLPRDRHYAHRPVRKDEVFQFPDGRIEIRVAGKSLPYSTYDRLGTIDQGAIVDNKRLSHVLRTSQVVQASRDNRVVFRPSTAHRAD